MNIVKYVLCTIPGISDVPVSNLAMDGGPSPNLMKPFTSSDVDKVEQNFNEVPCFPFVVSLFSVFQCFYHAYMGTLIEEGLLGDNIVQMRIQIQCLFVPLSDMQSDFGIVVLACLLLR